MLSVLPIIDVANKGSFVLKIIAVIAGPNLVGALLFWRAKSRRRALTLPVAGTLAQP